MAAPNDQLQTTLYRRRPDGQPVLKHHLALEPVEGTDVHDVALEVWQGPKGPYLSLRVLEPSGIDLDPTDLRAFIHAAFEALAVMERLDAAHEQVAA